MMTPKRIILIVIGLFGLSTFSQTNNSVVDRITLYVCQIREAEARHKLSPIFTDGIIEKHRKILGIRYHSEQVGGFAATYLLQDSILTLYRKGSAQYENRSNVKRTNVVAEFIFDKECLCYYLETKKVEQDGFPDSLVYSIELFIQNEKIMKANTSGDFELNPVNYCKEIIARSKDKIIEKNDLMK